MDEVFFVFWKTSRILFHKAMGISTGGTARISLSGRTYTPVGLATGGLLFLVDVPRRFNPVGLFFGGFAS